MPTPTLMPSPRQRFVDNLGLPLVNGMLYTFSAGTSDPLETYQDAAGTIAHKNPIRLDERGEATIYWLGNYRINLRSALGIQIPGYPVDNFNAIDQAGAAAASSANVFAAFLTNAGATLVAFLQAGAGAVRRTLQDKLRETVSVKDFGAKGDGTANDTVAIQAALNSGAKRVHFPAGTYLCAGLTSGTATLVSGEGGFSTTLTNSAATGTMLTLNNDLARVEAMRFVGTNGKTDVGIQINGSSQRVNECYFDGLGKGIQQNTGKNEYMASNNIYALCRYGIYNYGGGINGKSTNDKFVSCSTAVWVSDVGANGPTEGFTIEGALSYACGSFPLNQAVYEVTSSDYTRIIGGIHDGNNSWVLRGTDSRRMDLGGMAYMANNFAPAGVSTILLQGDCSNFNGSGARIEFSPYYGLQAVATAGAYSADINLTGFYLQNNSSMPGGGDILIDSCTDMRISGSVLGTAGAISVAANATYRNSNVTITNSRVSSPIYIGAGGCVVNGSDNKGFVTRSTGIATIPNASTSVTVPHGLTVLTGRQVTVSVTNAADFKVLNAAADATNIVINASNNTGATTVFWTAWVF